MKIAALVIGNELLSGKIADRNIAVLAEGARRAGLVLNRVNVIRDDHATIVAELRQLSESHAWVFSSGGIGPTHDDLTLQAAAEAFRSPLVMDSRLEVLLRRHLGERLRVGHLEMARVPRDAEVLFGDAHTWPIIRLQNCWLLPGVPELFSRSLAPIFNRIGKGQPILSEWQDIFLDEGTVKEHLDNLVATFPDVEIGSYPRFSPADSSATGPAVQTRITFDGSDPERLQAALACFRQAVGADACAACSLKSAATP